jgi:IS30 family transposase
MAKHARFKTETKVQICFCDPQSPWWRGSNENTNGLLRQYWPKGAELRNLTQAECDDVACG